MHLSSIGTADDVCSSFQIIRFCRGSAFHMYTQSRTMTVTIDSDYTTLRCHSVHVLNIVNKIILIIVTYEKQDS